MPDLPSSDGRPRPAAGATPVDAASAPDRTVAVDVLLGVASPALLCGLGWVIERSPGMRLAGAAQALPEFLALCRRLRAGVALLDPQLGAAGAVRALFEAVRTAAPALRCVLVLEEVRPHFVREALRAGATGFIDRGAGAGEIRDALVAATNGRCHVAPDVASSLAQSLMVEGLTRRETEVLALLARGDCNKVIARDLEVGVGTVKTHVRAIMTKLGSRSRTDAVLAAARLGLVALPR